jgi:hypothetical protein
LNDVLDAVDGDGNDVVVADVEKIRPHYHPASLEDTSKNSIG